MRQRVHTVRPAAAGYRRGGRLSGASASATLTAALVLLLAACGDGSGGAGVDRLGSRPEAASASAQEPGTANTAAPSAVPSNGPQGAISRQLLRFYQTWWDARVAAYAKNTRPGATLSVLSTGQALSDSLANIHRLQEAGMVMQGRPHSRATVTALDSASAVRTATIVDCLDVSGWHQVDARTKRNRDPQQRYSRYPVVVTARTDGGRWLISRIEYQTAKTC
jgi:hypothetical protein